MAQKILGLGAEESEESTSHCRRVFRLGTVPAHTWISRHLAPQSPSSALVGVHALPPTSAAWFNLVICDD